MAPGRSAGGLVGFSHPSALIASYWDGDTSGQPDGAKATRELQGPTGYHGIYSTWNLDLDGDGESDDPWNFGTTSEYPALSVDVDGDGRATWQEFGYQLRMGPGLTTSTPSDIAEVELAWTDVDTRHWSPPPGVTYTLLRREDAASEPIATGVTDLAFLDQDVKPGATYFYQVAVALAAGEATRSAEVEVAVPAAAVRPPRAVGTPPEQALAPGEQVELDADNLFEDPQRRTLAYAVVSSAPSVVAASVDGSTVTLEGRAPGTATITVTAENTDGATAEQSFTVSVRVAFLVPLFPSGSDDTRQGFVRIVNHADNGGAVRVEAIDDAGTSYPPLTLTLPANETVHFNSDHLEDGAIDRGLSGATGPGAGYWWLRVDAALNIEVLSYIRTVDGFLTAMHDVAPATEDGHRIVIFNPGSNTSQVSELRLINPTGSSARATVRGVDDTGASPGDAVRLTVAARTARTVTAADLEADGLGDGAGKWRLSVESPPEVQVMSLLRSPGGHLTNLSTAPEQSGVRHVPLFPGASDALGRQGFVRIVNRSDDDGTVSVAAFDDTDWDYDPVTAALAAGQALQFNSIDLEDGNADKGTLRQHGPGRGPLAPGAVERPRDRRLLVRPHD